MVSVIKLLDIEKESENQKREINFSLFYSFQLADSFTPIIAESNTDFHSIIIIIPCYRCIRNILRPSTIQTISCNWFAILTIVDKCAILFILIMIISTNTTIIFFNQIMPSFNFIKTCIVLIKNKSNFPIVECFITSEFSLSSLIVYNDFT